jgi:hypothetical protein
VESSPAPLTLIRIKMKRLVPIQFPGAPTPNESSERILAAALALLDQGTELLRNLPADAYVARVPVAFNGSIGGHYRHCLDHFVSLLRGLDSEMVDYDDRERDRRVETDLEFALSLNSEVTARLRRLPISALDAPVNARCEVSYVHGNSPVTASSFGREMVYAIAHAIHHFALIAVMARLLGIRLPDKFGIAPSTVAHQGTHVAAA